MKPYLHAAAAAALILTASCKMENPLLVESPLPYGAPQFDKIRTEHYLPAFKEGIAEARAEIDAITSNPEEPTFANTIEALEFAGETLGNVSSIFYNLLEAESTPEMQAIAEEISPMMTEYSMYVSLNDKLFGRIRNLWERRDSLGLAPDQYRLLDETYKSFARNGANLSPEDKQTYSKYQEELSLLSLKFSSNLLASTNAYKMNLTDEADLEGLPQYVRDMGAAAARENGQQGWTFDLSYPSYSAFIKFSARPELRKQIYLAYNSIAYGGEFDNSEICIQLADLRLKTAKLLGYETYADYMVEDRMAGSVENVDKLLDALLVYIENHLQDRITLADTARRFLVSESSVNQLFRKRMKVSFYRFVTQRRLIAAKVLLQDGLPAEQISARVGFGDYSSFYRAFKREYGISPAEYRRLQE